MDIKYVIECRTILGQNRNQGPHRYQLRKALTFVCNNYEIQFKEGTYKQIKGCPMGAHFALPFAIITMHHLENVALKMLEDEHNFLPVVYKRYIDDILIGPLTRSSLVDKIAKTFNAVNNETRSTFINVQIVQNVQNLRAAKILSTALLYTLRSYTSVACNP